MLKYTNYNASQWAITKTKTKDDKIWPGDLLDVASQSIQWSRTEAKTDNLFTSSWQCWCFPYDSMTYWWPPSGSPPHTCTGFLLCRVWGTRLWMSPHRVWGTASHTSSDLVTHSWSGTLRHWVTGTLLMIMMIMWTQVSNIPTCTPFSWPVCSQGRAPGHVSHVSPVHSCTWSRPPPTSCRYPRPPTCSRVSLLSSGPSRPPLYLYWQSLSHSLACSLLTSSLYLVSHSSSYLS